MNDNPVAVKLLSVYGAVIAVAAALMLACSILGATALTIMTPDPTITPTPTATPIPTATLAPQVIVIVATPTLDSPCDVFVYRLPGFNLFYPDNCAERKQ